MYVSGNDFNLCQSQPTLPYKLRRNLCLYVQLREEFLALHLEARPLKQQWNLYKDQVLELARSRPSTREYIEALANDYDEGRN